MLDPEGATNTYAMTLADTLGLDPEDPSHVAFLQLQALAFNRAFLIVRSTIILTSKDKAELADLAFKALASWNSFKSNLTTVNAVTADKLINDVLNIVTEGKAPSWLLP